LLVVGSLFGCLSETASAPNAPIRSCSTPACDVNGHEMRLDEALHVVSLVTYDGSGQAVHPDVVVTPPGWSTHIFHLALTPYPYTHDAFENPSIYGSDDGVKWVVDSGVSNPIVPKPPQGHLADPALVYVPETQELWIYYLRASDSSYIDMVRSPDAVHWSSPRNIGAVKSYFWLSPSVVHRAPGDWQMWSVNGGAGCSAPTGWIERRTSTDGLIWSDPVRVNLDQPGFLPWHVAVTWIPSLGQFWALYAAKITGQACGTPGVFLATSADGLNWVTYPSPVLVRGAILEFSGQVYRSTMTYDSLTDVVRFWYSGAQTNPQGPEWSIATQQLRRADLFRQLEAIPRTAVASSLRASSSWPSPEPEMP